MFTKAHLEQHNLISKKTSAVYDPGFTAALKQIPWVQWLEKSPPFDCRQEYLEKIHIWIHSTKLNKITGLERFSQQDLTVGTTQAFDEFYLRHSQRRLRFFRGEYAYHRRVGRTWRFLEDEALHADDAIIISWPFCSTGKKHEGMNAILDEALKLKLPVLIDSAYFGTCHGLDFDYRHPAIELVCFSLTKGLGLGDMRSGVRYSNYQDDFPIRQQNLFNHTILTDAKIGLYMMENFSPDFIALKYREAQASACLEAGIQSTPCMHLALGVDSQWEDYTIDDKYRRIGIRELVKAHFKTLRAT